MFIHWAEWHNSPSFRAIPITKDCPFNEVLYDPETKILMIIGQDKKEKPMFIPKLDRKGRTIVIKDNKIQEERQIMDMYYEYYIESIEDIRDFIALFAINNDHPALSILYEK